MTPDQADALAASAAAYVHIPFCSAVCPYCDFAVVAGADHLAGRYIDAVCTEIRRSDPWRPLEAVYFGGGTPSHIEPRLLGLVLDSLSDRHGIAANAEITLEVNPEDLSPSRAGELRALGFNRVSFGAQSFDPLILSCLGRRHGPGHIETSVTTAREAGFSNVSLDLIFGTPGETDRSWAATLGQVLDLDPTHLSCYALTVEPGTPLARAVREGAPAPDPDVQADRYETAESLLGDAGFARYEVSNWCRPGFECRYNMTVWAQGQYEAYGNGAHGFREGRRYRNVRRIDAYIDAVESGGSPRAGAETLRGWDAELDRLFVGLRRTVGVADGPGVKSLLQTEQGERLLDAGVIAHEDHRLKVLRPLLTDEVLRCVLDLSAH